MMPCCSSPFQCLAIPLRKSGSGFVGALKKLQQRQLRRGSAAHIVIAQEEFSQILTVEGLLRTNRDGRQSRWFWSGIGVESGGRETVIARPEPTTDHFMRVGFPRHAIGPWTLWCAPSGKQGERQVEATPEEVDGTALAQKRRAVALHDGVGLHQDAPEALGVDRVVGGVDLIDITANGILHFAGQGIDGDLDAQGVQAGHEFPVKRGDGAGEQRQRFRGSLACANGEIVLDEVKCDFKGAPVIGNGRGRQPSRGDIEGDMPPVVEKGTQFHSDFAHDLRPQMQGLAGVPPGLIGEGWPALPSFPLLCVACVLHGLLHLIVSLLHSFAPRGLHDVRLAAWSAASKASCSQEPRYKAPLMKKVGVPCTPLRSPPSTSSSMRASARWSARARAYCCRSRPTASANWARSASARVCWWWKM